MNVILLLRVLGVLFYYDALISAVKIVDVNGPIMLCITVLPVLSILLGDRFKEKKFLRNLSSLFPLLILIFMFIESYDPFSIAALLVPAIYVVMTNFTERYEVHYYYLQSLLKVMLVLNLATTLYAFKWDSTNVNIFLCCYLSVVTLIFATRGARMGSDNSVRNASMELAMILGTSFSSFAGVGIIWFLAKCDVIEKILDVIGFLFGGIVYLLDSLYIKSVVSLQNDKQPEKKELEKVLTDRVEYAGTTDVDNSVNSIAGTTLLTIISVFIFIVLMGCLIVIIKALITSAIEMWISSKGENIKYDSNVHVEKDMGIRSKARKSRGNRAKIRKLYKDYIVHVNSTGQVRQKSDTSLDILERSCKNREMNVVSAEMAEKTMQSENELRDLYIKVRYDTEYCPTNADVKKAKALLKDLN